MSSLEKEPAPSGNFHDATDERPDIFLPELSCISMCVGIGSPQTRGLDPRISTIFAELYIAISLVPVRRVSSIVAVILRVPESSDQITTGICASMISIFILVFFSPDESTRYQPVISSFKL